MRKLLLICILFANVSCGDRQNESELIILNKNLGINTIDSLGYLSRVPSLINTQHSIFVTESKLNSIITIDNNLQYINHFGQHGDGPKELNGISQITISDNRLFVFDDRHRRIAEFTILGEFTSSIPVNNSYSGTYRFVVDHSHNIYITSPDDITPILKINKKGEVVDKLGQHHDFDNSQNFVRNFRHLLLNEQNQLISVSVTEPIIEIIDLDNTANLFRIELHHHKNLNNRLNFIQNQYNKQPDSRTTYTLFQDVYYSEGHLYLLYMDNPSEDTFNCNKIMKLKLAENNLKPISVFSIGNDNSMFQSFCINNKSIYAFETNSAEIQKFNIN
jgi:hypothetical protein